MWFVRNIGGMDGFLYSDIRNRYWFTEEFLSTHYPPVRKKQPEAVPGVLLQYYVNGDVRSFHAAWNELNQFLMKMYASGNDVPDPSLRDGLIKILKWKISVIADFYKTFMRDQIIGKPTDVLFFEPRKAEE
jgi:hypothetical protein